MKEHSMGEGMKMTIYAVLIYAVPIGAYWIFVG